MEGKLEEVEDIGFKYFSNELGSNMLND